MTATHRWLVLFAALTLVTAGIAAPVLAQEDGEDEDARTDDEREDDEERSVEIETEGEDVTISLERETEPREDEVEMRWRADEATFELGYETENATREVERGLEATFGALVEYEDANGNDAYDPGEEVVSGTVLGDGFEEADEHDLEGEAQWRQPVVEDVTRDGEQGKQITTTADLADEGIFELRFLAFGSFVDLEGTSLAPTGAKIDIVVDGYAYQANGTRLALLLETETEDELEQETDDDETGVAANTSVDEEQGRLVFTWRDTAQVDGETRDVATTVLSEETETEREDGEAEHETERTFALSYPRGEEIVHDPKAEVQTAGATTADAPMPSLLGLLAAIGGLALACADARGRR